MSAIQNFITSLSSLSSTDLTNGFATLLVIVGAFVLLIKWIVPAFRDFKNLLVEMIDKSNESADNISLIHRNADDIRELREESQKNNKLILEQLDIMQRSINEEKEARLIECEKRVKTELKKLKEKLTRDFSYFCAKGEWTDIEAESFWELFQEYEEIGGDSYMHDIVQPRMKELKIIYLRGNNKI